MSWGLITLILIFRKEKGCLKIDCLKNIENQNPKSKGLKLLNFKNEETKRFKFENRNYKSRKILKYFFISFLFQIAIKYDEGN